MLIVASSFDSRIPENERYDFRVFAVLDGSSI